MLGQPDLHLEKKQCGSVSHNLLQNNPSGIRYLHVRKWNPKITRRKDKKIVVDRNEG